MPGERNSGNVCTSICFEGGPCVTKCSNPIQRNLENLGGHGSSGSFSTLSSAVLPTLFNLTIPQVDTSFSSNFDEVLTRVNQTLSNLPSCPSVQIADDKITCEETHKETKEKQSTSPLQTETLKTEMINLIKAGQWSAAKSLAVQKASSALGKTELANKENLKLIWDVRNNRSPTDEVKSVGGTASILCMLGFLDVITKNTLAGEMIDKVKNVYTVAYGNPTERYEALETLGKEVALGVGLGALGGIVGISLSKLSPTAKRVGLFNTAPTSKHPLVGLSPEDVVQVVDEMGLKTPRDQLILWSGLGRGNIGVKLSQQYARANGGVTLEMTPGGSWLDKMDLFGSNSHFTQEEAKEIWESVSIRMIQQAEGQVRSLIGVVNPGSIYRQEQVELLIKNEILGLDELNLKPRYKFK